MKEVIDYLKNPMKKGVYNRVYKLNIKCLKEIYEEIAKDEDHPNNEGAKITLEDESSLFDNEFFIDNLSECIAGTIYKSPFDEFYDLLNINRQTIKEEVEKNVKEYKFSTNEALHEEIWNNTQNLFDSKIIYKTFDVIHIEDISERMNNKFIKLFEVTTIKEDTNELFETFMKKIPHISENFETIKRRISFSSRNIFKPYPFVLELWLKDESSVYAPKDLLDLIEAASNYHKEKEWRTSVILSAIAIESILADLYEEEKKDHAPDLPLGALFEKVREVAKIPLDIQSTIKAVNQARIAAVHRSKSPVSDRDADIALYGTTKTTMWFAERY